MATDLEDGQRQGGSYDIPRRVPYAVLESRYRLSQFGEYGRQPRTGYAIECDQEKLDHSQRGGLVEGIQNGLGRSIGEGGRHVPHDTESLQQHVMLAGELPGWLTRRHIR